MHEEFDDLLLRYTANSLNQEERARMEAHLAACAECRAALTEWRAIESAVRRRAAQAPVRLPPLRLPADSLNHQEDIVTLQALPLTRRTGRSWAALAALAAALAVVFIAFALPSNRNHQPLVYLTDDLTPEVTDAPQVALAQYQPGSIRGAFELGGSVTDVSTDAADLMQSAGMNWMKVQIRYAQGDPADAAAPIIDTAHERGFKILLNVTGNPEELATGGQAYNEAFAAYLGQLAAFSPDGIEVWSEPNLDLNWPQEQLDGASYAQLLRVSYQAIKAANPDVMVISGAPAPTSAEPSFPDNVVNDDHWLREFVEAGGLNAADCVGAHYVEGVVSPDQNSGDPRDNTYTRYFPTMLETYRSITQNSVPICFTELGYLSGEGLSESLPDYFAWAASTTVAQQAEWLARAAQRAAESGSVRLMIVWNVNFAGEAASQSGYSIIRRHGFCPTCDMLASRNAQAAQEAQTGHIPQGMVASEVPAEMVIAAGIDAKVGDTLDVLLETGYELPSQPEDSTVVIPYDHIPVIQDAAVISPVQPGTVLLVLSPEDAALLSWLLNEELPITFRLSSD